nr:hypothetical protein [Xanthomonas codiaei]
MRMKLKTMDATTDTVARPPARCRRRTCVRPAPHHATATSVRTTRWVDRVMGAVSGIGIGIGIGIDDQ